MKITCDKCGCELTEPGGLIFSPPDNRLSEKYHLCTGCWMRLVNWMAGLEEHIKRKIP